MPPHEPSPSPPCVIPELVYKVKDPLHPGASIFFDNVNALEALKLAVGASYTWLYSLDSFPTRVETITLILRSFDGVAHTISSDPPGTYEIHFNLDYIKKLQAPARDEILGVLVHEVVHCYQYNGNGTCPSGVTEGIADFVRLQAGFAPPHWRRSAPEKWDSGYDATAYFFDWLEKRCGKGKGTIQQLNESMKDSAYDLRHFEDITKDSIDSLYKLYCKELAESLEPNRETIPTAEEVHT